MGAIAFTDAHTESKPKSESKSESKSEPHAYFDTKPEVDAGSQRTTNGHARVCRRRRQ
jgi:hypothetical protein